MSICCAKGFRGGYLFKNIQGIPKANVEEMKIPKYVVIPFAQGFGEQTIPLVKAGDSVKAGQIIGKGSEGISTPVHSSVNGTVREIREVEYKGKKILAAILDASASQDIVLLEGAKQDLFKLNKESISRLLYMSGVSSLGATGLPTLEKSSALEIEKVKCLIVCALETQPFAMPTGLVYESKISAISMGIQALQRFYQDVPVYIGVSSKDKKFAQSLENALAQSKGIAIKFLSPKYPQELPEILTESLTGICVPDGQKPDAIGAVVLDIADTIAVYEALSAGKPVIEKWISLGGKGYKENKILKVRVGTPVSEIAEQFARRDTETRFLLGDPLTGDMAENMQLTPIGRDIKSTSCIEDDKTRHFLAFLQPGFRSDSNSKTFVSSFLPFGKKLDTNLHGEHRPCIQCAYCEDICPRPLYPHLLHKYCSHGMAEEAKGIRLHACIECGLCSYVCPSKISIMNDIQKGKEELKKEL